MREPDHQKENPDSLAGEIGVEGIEALPKRVERYGTAKKGALDVAKYMAGCTKHQAMAAKVTGCGDYLLFRHFFTVDKVKLHAALYTPTVVMVKVAWMVTMVACRTMSQTAFTNGKSNRNTANRHSKFVAMQISGIIVKTIATISASRVNCLI